MSYTELIGGIGGFTALLHAAREGHVETARALVAAGAPVDQVSGGDHTSPMLIATINGHFDLALVLLESGADPTLASDAGTTPLYASLNVHWAPKARYPQPGAQKQQEASYLEFMRTMLRQIIEDMEWTVSGEACDGQEAIDQYRLVKPDLVLLDITMPNLDGTEALKSILAEDPQAQIVMITALGQKDQVLNAIKTGARDFIIKPFDHERVSETLTRILSPSPVA